MLSLNLRLFNAESRGEIFHDKPQSLETATIMYDRTLRLSIQRKTSIVLRVGIDKDITDLTYHPWRIKAI